MDNMQIVLDEMGKELNISWPEVVKKILEEGSISFAEKKAYIMDTILICAEEESEEEEVWESRLQALNENACITGYINAHEDFIRISDAEAALWGYMTLQVKFETWLYEDTCFRMSLGVYENHLYVLSGENIEAVCKARLLAEGENGTWDNMATRILSREEEPICSYVKKNMDVFLYLLMENAGEGVRDQEEIVLQILNDKNISLEKKKSYIALMKNYVIRLRDIQDVSLWDGLLGCRAVSYTEQNILDYYFKGGEQWSDTLIGFINEGSGKLNFAFLRQDKSYGERAENILWNCVIDCMELNNEKYEEILSGMWFYYNDFPKQDFSGDKMEILIRRQIIHMTEKNLKHMRENYPAQTIFFVKTNMEKYLELLTEEILSREELLSLLEDKDVTVSTKKKLLDKTSEKISVVGKNYTPAVKQKILAEHFDPEDLEFLLQDYKREREKKTQELIRSIAVSYIQEIGEQGYQVAPGLLRYLLGEETLGMEEKQLLLSQNISDFSKKEAISLLRQTGLTQILPVFEGKNPRVEKSMVMDNLLPAFQKKGWIGKVKEDEEGGTFYRLYSRGGKLCG